MYGIKVFLLLFESNKEKHLWNKKYSTLPNKRHDQNNRHGTFLANSKQQKMAALRHFLTVN